MPTPSNILPIPDKLVKFSKENNINNYFKQLHDKIVELENRIIALENP